MWGGGNPVPSGHCANTLGATLWGEERVRELVSDLVSMPGSNLGGKLSTITRAHKGGFEHQNMTILTY